MLCFGVRRFWVPRIRKHDGGIYTKNPPSIMYGEMRLVNGFLTRKSSVARDPVCSNRKKGVDIYFSFVEECEIRRHAAGLFLGANIQQSRRQCKNPHFGMGFAMFNIVKLLRSV